MNNNEIKMNEYIQLREELRLYLSRKSRYEIILTAISVIVGLSATLKEPLPILLMSALPILLIEEQTRRIDAIYRIASYIRVHIEPFLDGLNWESYGTKFLKKRSMFLFSAHGLDVIILSCLFVIQFIAAIYLWISNLTEKHFFNIENSWLLYPIGAIYFVCLIFTIYRFKGIRKRSENYTREWEKVAE